jgi:hypothetical protein
MLRALDRLAQPLQEFLQMLAPVDKVDLGRINHQQATRLAMKEEVRLSIHYSLERFDPRTALSSS